LHFQEANSCMTNTPLELEKKIKNLSFKGLPFVVFKRPHTNKLSLFWQDSNRLQLFNKDNQSGFVMAPFLHSKDAYLIIPDGVIHADFMDIETEQSKQLNKQTVLIKPLSIQTSALKKAHMQLVSKAISSIENQLFEKVVVARKTDQSYSKSPWSIFKELAFNYPHAFCYWWYHPTLGSWQGASPETLMKIENNELQTISLAGTQAVVSDQYPKWNSKEIHEQAIVTADIVASLEALKIKVSIGNTFNSMAGVLWHLRTDIKGLVVNQDIFSIINSLHPSPAISGLPRQDALNFIKSHEALDRSFYSGYLGLVHMDENGTPTDPAQQHIVQAELYVNLRCMELINSKAIIYVGSGITVNSNPLNEWEETVLKSKTMSKVLAS